jgi:cysteine desulfurase / selenocysteine lyase
VIRQRGAKSSGGISEADLSRARRDTQDRNLGPLVRASVHYYNTEEEVSRFCETLERIL